jgi:DNA-binding LacI/PurR family transcriptional regulator/anti-anti-sigma regulatory factor
MTSGRKAIGVLASQLSGAYFGTLLAGIHAVTRRHDPRLIAIQAAPHELVRSRLAMDQVDGWIVINSREGLELLANSGLPIVTIGAQAPGGDIPAVFPDNFGGMRSAVSHVLEHGHTRIAFVGDLANNDIRQRYDGYQAALAERGLVLDPALVFPAAGSYEEAGASALRQLHQAGLSCTALVGATDETAIGALSAAQALGYRVPDDLAIVGFDDIILAHSATPPLTTIRVPIRTLGTTAAELLLAQLEGRSAARGITYVATALIARRSCGCSNTILTPAAAEGSGDQSWQEALAGQLAQLAHYPLPVDPAVALGDIWPGGSMLIDALVAALDNTSEANLEALYTAWKQFVALNESIEAMFAILGLLERVGARQLVVESHDPGAPARLEALFAHARLEMLRARLSPESEGLRSYSTLVQQTYVISKTLLTAERGGAQRLDWLSQTPMSWACLGLWDSPDNRGRPALTFVGSYSRDNRDGYPAPIGQRYAGPQFPPADLLPGAVRETGAEIVIVLPIKTAAHDWGALALAGPIQYLHSCGNYDALTAIATLLGAALEREQLEQTLQRAYERELGLANIVRELGCPVIPLLPEVLLIPLVGALDSRRALQVIEAVLDGVTRHQATTVLLDISGVPLVDTQVANSLLQTSRAAGLLGARVVLVGVRPEIAQSIVGLGIELQHLSTQPTLAAAVQALLNDQRARKVASDGRRVIR